MKSAIFTVTVFTFAFSNHDSPVLYRVTGTVIQPEDACPGMAVLAAAGTAFRPGGRGAGRAPSGLGASDSSGQPRGPGGPAASGSQQACQGASRAEDVPGPYSNCPAKSVTRQLEERIFYHHVA
jgi:hypothetical protein